MFHCKSICFAQRMSDSELSWDDFVVADSYESVVESLSDDDKYLVTVEAKQQLAHNEVSSHEVFPPQKKRRLVKRGGDSDGDDDDVSLDKKTIVISSESSPSAPSSVSSGNRQSDDDGGSASSDDDSNDDDSEKTEEIADVDSASSSERKERRHDSESSSERKERRCNAHSSVAVYKVTRAMETCDDGDLTRYVEDNVFSRLYFGNQQRMSRGVQRLACDGRIRIIANRDKRASIDRCFFCHATKICAFRLVVKGGNGQEYAVGTECANTFSLAHRASMLLNQVILLASAAHAKYVTKGKEQVCASKSIGHLGLRNAAIDLGRRLDRIVAEMIDLRAVNEDRDVYI